MSAFLNWQTLVRGDAAYVKGTEIEGTIPDGFLSRFAIYAVRRLTWAVDEHGREYTDYDVFYRVRDAEAAPDAHYRAGGRAPIFGEFDTLDEALAAIEPHRRNTEEVTWK